MSKKNKILKDIIIVLLLATSIITLLAGISCLAIAVPMALIYSNSAYLALALIGIVLIILGDLADGLYIRLNRKWWK